MRVARSAVLTTHLVLGQDQVGCNGIGGSKLRVGHEVGFKAYLPAPLPLLLAVEHLLEGDDAHGLGVRVLAEPGGEQPVRRLPGRRGQLGQARAGTVPRPVLQPAPGRLVGERPGRERALFLVQAAEQ